MDTIATIEFSLAAFFVFTWLELFFEKQRLKSDFWLRLSLLVTIFWLFIDASSYTITEDFYPFAIKYLVNFLAFTLGTMTIVLFLFYRLFYFKERFNFKQIYYLVPIIVFSILTFLIIFEFTTENIVDFDNFANIYSFGFPIYITVIQALGILYLPVVLIIHRKHFKVREMFALGIFDFLPVLAIIFAAFSGRDYSVIFGAVEVLIVATFLQRQHAKEHEKEFEDSQKIIEMFATQYDYVYLFNLENDRAEQLKAIKGNLGLNNKFKLFSSAKRYYFSQLEEYDYKLLSEALDVETIRERLSKEPSYTIEYRFPINSSLLWHQMKVLKLNNDEIIVGFSMMDRDITLNHLAQLRVSENFALFEVDIETATLKVIKDDGVVNVGTEGNSFPYKETILKIAEELEGEGKEFFKRISNMDYIKQQFAVEDKRTISFPVFIDGEKKWVHSTSFVTLRNEDATPAMFTIGFVLLDSMGAARQEVQLKYKEALDAAEAANKSKSLFLFNMSHDIRTPMNAITGFTNMAIKNIGNDDKVLDCLQKSQSAEDMLLVLVNNILEFSKIESGKEIAVLEELDIRACLENIEITLKELAEPKSIQINFDTQKIKDNFVYADKSRTIRILINIISNSIKYTQNGGIINVSCEQSEKRDGISNYLFTVSDNGIGMSEEFQKHVFEQFSRERTATISGVQGMGLGLAVVKRFVEILDGTIELESKQGVGTTFKITLPFKVLDITSSSKNNKIDLKNLSFKGSKILLVEDNELNREIASDILLEQEMNVECAENGQIAVDMLKDKGPDYYDFILMDIQMPVMNGYEATKLIRGMYPNANIPIIAISANAFTEDKAASIDAGMNDHIAKPLVVSELFASMSKLYKK